ncbi:MAG TPA: isochorismate synthase [Polyangiaceae bacterium]|jgi:menaquinone-specific isochorismate synthase|nr:isochorismate synthase [Polyangiaceae bacterium]
MSEQVQLGAAPNRAPETNLDVSELLRGIEQTLDRTCVGERAAVLTWAVPRVPGERLLSAASEGDALFWAQPAEGEVCALGAAFSLSANGSERFRAIQERAREIWPQLEQSAADPAAPEPCFFGGFAFQAGQAKSALWQDFGDARFILPRLSYLKNNDGAWLRLIVRQHELVGTERAALLELLSRALQALFAAPPAPPCASEVARDERSPEAWADLVTAIQREIAAGRAQKIVAARRLGLTLDRELLPSTVLARLRSDAPESTRFAVRVGTSTFLGATPERLLQKRGNELATEAVAGSIDTDGAASATRLLESSKDIREHEFVVSEILRLLEPLTSELSPGKREVHRLRTVLHLRTPIRARLRAASHVLELVSKLHPTPAVGGVPTTAAIDFICAHEPDERGWYAGPVGWFDAAGDGRFVVALRSGVVSGNRAELYAGAGIVEDSNAPSEFAETRWKLAALLGALGVSG